MWVVLLVALYAAALFLLWPIWPKDRDGIYFDHGGLPAPCPDGKGYWPRDCPPSHHRHH